MHSDFERIRSKMRSQFAKDGDWFQRMQGRVPKASDAYKTIVGEGSNACSMGFVRGEEKFGVWTLKEPRSHVEGTCASGTCNTRKGSGGIERCRTAILKKMYFFLLFFQCDIYVSETGLLVLGDVYNKVCPCI